METQYCLDNLLHAVAQDDFALIKYFMQEQDNPELPLIDGFNLLHLAAKKNSINLAKHLLTANFNPNYPIQDKSPQHSEPTSTFNLENISELNEIQLEILQDDIEVLGNASALHIAVKEGHSDFSELLLKHKANPNILDKGLCTPLHWAISRNNQRLITILLTYSANPNQPDCVGNTPLHEATRRNQQETIRALLEHHANPNIMDQFGETPFSLSKSFPDTHNLMLIYSEYSPENTILH